LFSSLVSFCQFLGSPLDGLISTSKDGWTQSSETLVAEKHSIEWPK